VPTHLTSGYTFTPSQNAQAWASPPSGKLAQAAEFWSCVQVVTDSMPCLSHSTTDNSCDVTKIDQQKVPMPMSLACRTAANVSQAMFGLHTGVVIADQQQVPHSFCSAARPQTERCTG